MQRLFARSRWLLRAPSLCRSAHRPVWKGRRALLPCATTGHRSVSSWGPTYAAVQLATQGKSLVMKADDGEEALLHPTWLRHNCQCPSCMSIEQKILDPSEIDPSISIESAELSGDRLELVWSGGHHGYIEIDWLKRRRPGIRKEEDSSTPKIATEMPVVSAVGITEDKEKLWQWLYYLNEYGVCLLTDFGSELGSTRQLVEKTMYNVQPTVYGKSYEVKVTENSIAIAYTPQRLGFHMDQQFYESPPGLQLLHCIRFDDCVEGGESVMLDMFAVVEEMREKYPQHFETLTRVPATFMRIHYDREDPVDIQLQSPHIILDKAGQIVAMKWTPTMEGPLDVPYEDIQPYYDAHYCLSNMLQESDYKLYHRLKPGDIMTFNNRRYVHSRTAFNPNGGQRHLQGFYVNIDHFKSAYQVVCKQLGKDTPMRRVFNMNSL